uniref:BTB domain-containing protein n=1 Tax=Anopheles albimanus TaxID=7167 RepID=A0A182FJQ2_ANOAL
MAAVVEVWQQQQQQQLMGSRRLCEGVECSSAHSSAQQQRRQQQQQHQRSAKLLQDESLVDVTLACSDGATIRAHKHTRKDVEKGDKDRRTKQQQKQH